MGKKENSNTRKRDVFYRLNYLYQAAHFALTMTPPNVELSKYYSKTMKVLALKNVDRMSPHIKRTICKECFVILLPGITSRVRNKRKSKNSKGQLIVKCMECGGIKRFLLKTDHRLWHDKDDNTHQVLELT